MVRSINILRCIELEGILWILALSYLAFIDPYETSHFTFCPFNNLGIDFCPGCGLGRSISLIYRGDLQSSLSTHPLGIFALTILTARIYKLTKNSYKKIKETAGVSYGKCSQYFT